MVNFHFDSGDFVPVNSKKTRCPDQATTFRESSPLGAEIDDRRSLEGHLAELDINPLMVLPSGQGVRAVDALVRPPRPHSPARGLRLRRVSETENCAFRGSVSSGREEEAASLRAGNDRGGFRRQASGQCLSEPGERRTSGTSPRRHGQTRKAAGSCRPATARR